MSAIPETHFAVVGQDRVAYQVLGDGPRDLVFSNGLWSHLDIIWEEPAIARYFRRLASFSRLILFDCRGTGLSDRPSDDGLAPIDRWMQDCLAVLDAVRSKTATIYLSSTIDSGTLALEFATRHPERCSGLVLTVATACWAAKSDYPQGSPLEVVKQINDYFPKAWGTMEMSALFAPSQSKNESTMRWMAKWQRSVASPAAMAVNMNYLVQMDSRHLLSKVKVPALIMGRQRYALIPLEQSRYIADHIPGARFVELPGGDAPPVYEGSDLALDEIEAFMTGRRHGSEPERAVVTILFTDIVDSTRRAAAIGDSQWRLLLERHDGIVREQVALYQGKFIESSGDGTLTTFDGPARAIECAISILSALKSLDIEIRAGLHTGEVELRDDGRVGGVAVHIGARVMSMAKAGEVLVSPTVQGILIGSRYKFEPRGTHTLKGVPGEWPLFALDG